MGRGEFKGAIFDMDGVLTKTAAIHAKAWKTLFDGVLKEREGNDFVPFDMDRDYKQYVDGKSRLDGIRSFLGSRSIELEEGKPGDRAKDTVHGL
ncbi:MAG TPA: hypothetical protein VKZ51_12200, partial [Cyclobacteriaceae bacterium]|nr:hypothetical protein [Cyclobacteriaceae bacterium]